MKFLQTIKKIFINGKGKTEKVDDTKPLGWNTVGTHRGINHAGSQYDLHFEGLSKEFRTNH